MPSDLTRQAKKGFVTVQDPSNEGAPVPFFVNVRAQDIIPPYVPNWVDTDKRFHYNKSLTKVKTYDNGTNMIYTYTFTGKTTDILKVYACIPIKMNTTFYKFPDTFQDITNDYFLTNNSYTNKFRATGFFFNHDSSSNPIKTTCYKTPSCSSTVSGPSATHYAYRPYIQDISLSNTNATRNKNTNSTEAGWWFGAGNNAVLNTQGSKLASLLTFGISGINILNAKTMKAHIIGNGPIPPVLNTATIDLSLRTDGSVNDYKYLRIILSNS